MDHRHRTDGRGRGTFSPGRAAAYTQCSLGNSGRRRRGGRSHVRFVPTYRRGESKEPYAPTLGREALVSGYEINGREGKKDMGVEKSLLAKDEEAVPRGATRKEGGGNRDKERKERKRTTILEGKGEKGRRLVGGGAKRGGKIKMAIKTPLSSSRKTHNGASNPLPPPSPSFPFCRRRWRREGEKTSFETYDPSPHTLAEGRHGG